MDQSYSENEDPDVTGALEEVLEYSDQIKHRTRNLSRDLQMLFDKNFQFMGRSAKKQLNSLKLRKKKVKKAIKHYRQEFLKDEKVIKLQQYIEVYQKQVTTYQRLARELKTSLNQIILSYKENKKLLDELKANAKQQSFINMRMRFQSTKQINQQSFIEQSKCIKSKKRSVSVEELPQQQETKQIKYYKNKLFQVRKQIREIKPNQNTSLQFFQNCFQTYVNHMQRKESNQCSSVTSQQNLLQITRDNSSFLLDTIWLQEQTERKKIIDLENINIAKDEFLNFPPEKIVSYLLDRPQTIKELQKQIILIKTKT